MSEPKFMGGVFVVDDSGSFTATSMPAATTNEYLLKANNLSDLPNRNTARENLGITVSVTRPVAPKLNDLWVDLDS